MEIKFKNGSYIKSIPDDETINGHTRGNRAKHIKVVAEDDEVIDLCELGEVIKFMAEQEITRKAEREDETLISKERD